MSKSIKDVFKEGVNTHSINLLWINCKKEEDQKYIYPTNDEKELGEKLLNISLNWAKQNKKAEVKIWYDSKLSTEYAIENTKQALDNLLREEGEGNITLHDIREIEFINDNEILFTQDIGVYFRVDYLKLIILTHELVTNGNDGAVFADLEYRDSKRYIKSDKIYNEDELFDAETMEKLKEYGVVVGQGPAGKENQFIQAVNDELTIDCLRYVVNADALRAINLLNSPQEIQIRIMKGMYNIPFLSTISEITKLYMGLKAGSIEVNAGFLENRVPDERWIKYDPKKHGYEPLGNAIIIAGTLRFVSEDYQAKPVIGYRLGEIIKYVSDDNDYMGVRGESRNGCSHIDKPVLPPEGHEPYVPHYWPVDSNNFSEVELSGNVEQV